MTWGIHFWACFSSLSRLLNIGQDERNLHKYWTNYAWINSHKQFPPIFHSLYLTHNQSCGATTKKLEVVLAPALSKILGAGAPPLLRMERSRIFDYGNIESWFPPWHDICDIIQLPLFSSVLSLLTLVCGKELQHSYLGYFWRWLHFMQILFGSR